MEGDSWRVTGLVESDRWREAGGEMQVERGRWRVTGGEWQLCGGGG